jgi:hypothetical protein
VGRLRQAPLGSPAQALDYLGRYTHKVAISNHRLLELRDGQITFRWKDYRQNHAQKIMTLDVEEFIRRFLLHVLPSGFVRIRHFGFLSNRHREAKLAQCRQLLAVPESSGLLPVLPLEWKSLYQELTGISLQTCPACRQGQMVRVEILAPVSRSSASPTPRLDSS